MEYWTPDEIILLQKIYGINSDKQLAVNFPNHNIKAIRIKARKMKMKRTSSYYEPILPKITKIEKAYLAGLFDGEGCIHIAKNKPRPKGKNPFHKLMICITNTDREITQYLFSTFGGRLSINLRRKNQQECQTWWLYSQGAKVFLKMIYPFLRIKKKQAEIAIEFQDKIKYGCKEITTEILRQREKYREHLIKLKGASNRL